jgi:hypothetical protein
MFAIRECLEKRAATELGHERLAIGGPRSAVHRLCALGRKRNLVSLRQAGGEGERFADILLF